MQSPQSNLRAIKLHSMRETPLILWYFQRLNRRKIGEKYSWQFKMFYTMLHVKMFSTWGQPAWNEINFVNFTTNTSKNLQRLDKSFHQRLNVKDPINKIWFEQWLIGITDGDGTFSITKSGEKWNLTYKLSQGAYNTRLLYYIKSQLGVGKVNYESTGIVNLRIRDRKALNEVIFPIFDKYPLLTSKYFHYLKFKKAYSILVDPYKSIYDKNLDLEVLRKETPNNDYVSPAWEKINYKFGEELDYEKSILVISKPWIIGFTEAEGSFYITKRDLMRYSHGFGLSQKSDKQVLEAIGYILHIKNPVRSRLSLKNPHYLLDTMNSRSLNNVIKYFKDTMKGIKSVEYKIWSRTFNKDLTYQELEKIQQRLRNLRAIKPDLSLWKDK